MGGVGFWGVLTHCLEVEQVGRRETGLLLPGLSAYLLDGLFQRNVASVGRNSGEMLPPLKSRHSAEAEPELNARRLGEAILDSCRPRGKMMACIYSLIRMAYGKGSYRR